MQILNAGPSQSSASNRLGLKKDTAMRYSVRVFAPILDDLSFELREHPEHPEKRARRWPRRIDGLPLE
jgi:hypothetical protein